VNWRGDKQMGLETAFRELQTKVMQLHEVVCALQMFIQDRPGTGGTILVEQLEDKAIDSLSPLEEAQAILKKLLQTPGIEGRGAAARNALLRVHECVDEFAQNYRNELFSYENICSLQQLSTERGREWPSWFKVVREAIEACAAPLDTVRIAIRACWREGTDGTLVINSTRQTSCQTETGS
jgi:hypothetical protein